MLLPSRGARRDAAHALRVLRRRAAAVGHLLRRQLFGRPRLLRQVDWRPLAAEPVLCARKGPGNSSLEDPQLLGQGSAGAGGEQARPAGGYCLLRRGTRLPPAQGLLTRPAAAGARALLQPERASAMHQVCWWLQDRLAPELLAVARGRDDHLALGPVPRRAAAPHLLPRLPRRRLVFTGARRHHSRLCARHRRGRVEHVL
mmetsp:Transcript_16240/g.52913  ORF Transcript_16240/g.52913 Transcript_16240/m.52913 type:complete len:201 (-) Transcript_16240:519-1121(-)